MQLVTGHQTVIHHSILVVCNLALTEETSEWATTVVTHTDLTDSTVTVSITKVDQQVLHSSELLVFPTDKDSAWMRCGCWTVPYGHGGQGANSNYCGRCCGQGGQGGSGLVKITYV